MVVLSVFNSIMLLLRIDRNPDTLRTTCDSTVILLRLNQFFFSLPLYSFSTMEAFHWLIGCCFVCWYVPPARLWRVKHQFESCKPLVRRCESCKFHEWDESVKKWDVVRELVLNLTRVQKIFDCWWYGYLVHWCR